MLFGEEAVRANVRNREGKRVYYLAKGDQLTSSARDWLSRERIDILPAEQAKPQRYRLLSGGYVEEKPEHMTHLHGDVLVPKTHPRIVFRGKMAALSLLAFRQAAEGVPLEGLSQHLTTDNLPGKTQYLPHRVFKRLVRQLAENEFRFQRVHFPPEPNSRMVL